MKSNVAQIFLLFCVLNIMTGCLQTRSDLNAAKEKKVIQSQVANLQKQTADVDVRFSEINEDLRTLDGKIEELDTKFVRSQNGAQQKNTKSESDLVVLQDKVKVLEEAMMGLDKKFKDLQEDFAEVKSAKAAVVAEKPVSQDGLLNSADGHFNKKEWKSAIVNYQKYLENYPKGKKAGFVTLKIAESLEGLGKVSDARLFYEEVVSNFPGSQSAKKAESRLKQLKK
jgi:TolA-binding protein